MKPSTINSNTSYSLRPATLDDAYVIWQIMDTCFQTLEHKEYFICDDLDYVKNILSGQGFGIVACDIDNTIVGNLLVKYPGMTEENLGYDVFEHAENKEKTSYDCSIQLTSDNLQRVLHMDSATVLPAHRGHGLEARMIAYAETLVDTAKYRYSFATVAPENVASLKSLERNEYQVMVTKEKYNGLRRNILMKIL